MVRRCWGGWKSNELIVATNIHEYAVCSTFEYRCAILSHPLTKLVPPSVLTNTGLPLLAMKRRRAFVKESVSSDFDVDGSDRQTRENRAIPLHLTSSLLHHKWAKEVDPSMTERRLSGGTPSSERSAIFWLHTGASRRLQLIQLARKLHTTELARIIQNFVRRSDRTYSFPEWLDAKWCTICSEKRSINSHS